MRLNANFQRASTILHIAGFSSRNPDCFSLFAGISPGDYAHESPCESIPGAANDLGLTAFAATISQNASVWDHSKRRGEVEPPILKDSYTSDPHRL
jgi:hypothetical protein